MAIAYEPGMTAADKRAANAAVNQARVTNSAATARAAAEARVSRDTQSAARYQAQAPAVVPAPTIGSPLPTGFQPTLVDPTVPPTDPNFIGPVNPVVPTPPVNPLNTGITKTQVDSVAAIKALLSSYGIGDLGDAITNAVVKGYSTDTIELIMQDPNSTDPLAVAFQMRFPANKARAAAGKAVLSPAEYLRAERSYTEVLKSYGVSNLASKEKLSQFISNDISATEVSDRVGIAINRVQNADADTKKALAEYYPMLNQADIIGAVLDPTEGLPALQRKIQIAEIGGAALAQGIKTAAGKTNIMMGASALADLGVTKAQAREGFQQVAELAPRGEFLSQISPGENYGQLQAEQEAFQGLASAKRARVSLTEQEKARFGGASGVNKASLASQTRGAI
jgi:hypothetical protein